MKKRSFLIVLTLLLCASMLFASCGEPVDTTPEEENQTPSFASKLNAILNPEYSYKAPKLTTTKTLSISGDRTDYSDGLVVFTDYTDDGMKITRVFSHFTNELVKSMTNTATVRYYVDLISSAKDSVFAVLAVTANNSDGFTDYFDTYNSDAFEAYDIPYSATAAITFYDAKGNELEKLEDISIGNIDYKYDDAYSTASSVDMITIGDKVYLETKDGAVKLIKEFKTQAAPSIDKQIGDYYYCYDYDSYGGDYDYEYYNQRISVYNKELVPVSHYAFPSYATRSHYSVLNNGDILVQYLTALPEDATEYDIYQNAGKYDLTTLIVSAATGATKALDVNYMVAYAMNVTELKQYTTENALADGIENIASIYYIDANKMINSAQTNMEVVSLGNDGAILQSLKLSDQYVGTPSLVQKGYYAVQTVYGDTVILNAKGEEVFRYDSSKVDTTASYVYTEDAIYDFSGKVVYNLKTAGAEVDRTIGRSALLLTVEKKVNEVTVTEYYLFNNGKATLLGTVGGESATAVQVRYGAGCCMVFTTGGKCIYYNDQGTKLLEIDADAYTDISSIICRDGYLIECNGTYYKLIYDIIED